MRVIVVQTVQLEYRDIAAYSFTGIMLHALEVCHDMMHDTIHSVL